MLSRSRLGASGFIAVRTAELDRECPDIEPDLMEEIKSLVERAGMGEVMVSAGSDCPAKPVR